MVQPLWLFMFEVEQIQFVHHLSFLCFMLIKNTTNKRKLTRLLDSLKYRTVGVLVWRDKQRDQWSVVVHMGQHMGGVSDSARVHVYVYISA